MLVKLFEESYVSLFWSSCLVESSKRIEGCKYLFITQRGEGKTKQIQEILPLRTLLDSLTRKVATKCEIIFIKIRFTKQKNPKISPRALVFSFSKQLIHSLANSLIH